MRIAIYALAAVAGIVIALLGDEPLWIPAVVALLAFPITAAICVRESKPGSRARTAPFLPATATALAGGLLTALAIRLALDAPGWLSATSADCGGASTGVQRIVLWASAVIFFLAALPVAATTFSIGRRLRPEGVEDAPPPPLALYPVAVALSGLALIAAGYVTTC